MTDETARLAALRKYRILDTQPERAFDDLTLLASQICQTPIAMITLIDQDRQWIKSRVGTSLTETARNVSFCTHAIQQRGIFFVKDAFIDARFRDNPLVTGTPKIRFYAGSPLVTPEGHALGTLCVIDQVPRDLTADQARALDALRRQVEMHLELRRNLDQLEAALEARNQAEAEQVKLVAELRGSLDKVDKLSALLPYASTCELNMVIPADPKAIPAISEGVVQLLQNKDWPEDEVIKVDLALQEALANGIRHGCRGDASKQVQCLVSFDSGGDLMIVVRDPGEGFEPSQVPNPLEGDNVFKPSGRGVYLINQLMDEVAFSDGGRQVEMRKKREKASAG